jgi:uncharacterized protein (TIGR03435 family)
LDGERLGGAERNYLQMRNTILCVSMLALSGAARGQEFEAVSVKPNKSGSTSSRSSTDQGLYRATNLTLKSLIMSAYDMKDYQVEGPDWITSERFDVTARFPPGLPSFNDPKNREQLLAAFDSMMQKMLADRFKLAVHRDQKSFSVYGLIVAKAGIKFKEAPDTGSRSDGGDRHYQGTSVTMLRFAEFLSRRMDLPVIDMTGLKGTYDVTLDWVPEQNDKANDAAIPEGPALPEALQDQLGLKVENRKTPIEVLIVDHAERVPTED